MATRLVTREPQKFGKIRTKIIKENSNGRITKTLHEYGIDAKIKGEHE